MPGDLVPSLGITSLSCGNGNLIIIFHYILFFQIVHPNNKNIRDIPGLAPPAQNYQIHSRRLLWAEAFVGLMN
jgi:hypothetical protein